MNSARRDVGLLFDRLQPLGNEQVDALIDGVGALIVQYGRLSAVLAAEWVEQVACAWLGDVGRVNAVEAVDTDRIRADILWMYKLHGDDMAKFRNDLLLRVDSWVRRPGRATLMMLAATT